MQTILVPTDFSATAKNAAHYAIELAKQTNATKIVFYNAYQAAMPTVTGDPIMPAIAPIEIEAFEKMSETGLANFLTDMQPSCPENIALETLSELDLLADGIEEAATKTGANLIVMGITGGGAIEENLIGSNTIDVAKHSTIPVIIVPAKAVFKPVKEITLAVDLKKVQETTPVQAIKTLLDATGAQLFVLHINDGDGIAEENEQTQVLNNLLLDYNPQFFFVNNASFIDGINDFVDDKNVDLLVTIPKKHGFFEMLFKKSHTKILAFHSHVPMMVVHD